MHENVDIERNLKQYLSKNSKSIGISPYERYASFDYCFSYFQSFKDQNKIKQLNSIDNVQTSCLQLGFYLASWGMYRGSSFLLQKSVKALEPVITEISNSEITIWEVDADNYSDKNIELLLDFRSKLMNAFQPDIPSDILITKIMLGVFGNVPAFDKFFKSGFGVSSFGKKALVNIDKFYNENWEIIEHHRKKTLSFELEILTSVQYTRAKVIDMIFFIEGKNK